MKNSSFSELEFSYKALCKDTMNILYKDTQMRLKLNRLEINLIILNKRKEMLLSVSKYLTMIKQIINQLQLLPVLLADMSKMPK